MPNTKEWSTGLKMTDVGDGILVQQDDRIYKARRWQLTPEVVSVVESAIRNRLTANWVEGHPSQRYLKGGDRFDAGIHHVTFARSHNEGWVFVLGGEAKPPHIKVVTFNRRYERFILRTGCYCRWEHSGGHNIYIEPADLDCILAQLDDLTIDEVEAARSARRIRSTVLPRVGIASESDLEWVFREYLRNLPIAPRRLEVRARCDGLIPDVLIDIEDALVVVELKFSRASWAELDQLHGYLALPAVLSRAKGRQIAGVLIARSFSEKIIELASASSSAVSFAEHITPSIHLIQSGTRIQVAVGGAVARYATGTPFGLDVTIVCHPALECEGHGHSGTADTPAVGAACTRQERSNRNERAFRPVCV